MWCGRLSTAHLQPLQQPLLTVTHLELDLSAQLAGQLDSLHCHFRNPCGRVLSSSVAALSTTGWQIYILADISKAAHVTKMHQWSINPATMLSVINVVWVFVTWPSETSASSELRPAFVCQHLKEQHLCCHNLFNLLCSDECSKPLQIDFFNVMLNMCPQYWQYL